MADYGRAYEGFRSLFLDEKLRYENHIEKLRQRLQIHVALTREVDIETGLDIIFGFDESSEKEQVREMLESVEAKPLGRLAIFERTFDGSRGIKLELESVGILADNPLRLSFRDYSHGSHVRAEFGGEAMFSELLVVDHGSVPSRDYNIGADWQLRQRFVDAKRDGRQPRLFTSHIASFDTASEGFDLIDRNEDPVGYRTMGAFIDMLVERGIQSTTQPEVATVTA